MGVAVVAAQVMHALTATQKKRIENRRKRAKPKGQDKARQGRESRAWRSKAGKRQGRAERQPSSSRAAAEQQPSSRREAARRQQPSRRAVAEQSRAGWGEGERMGVKIMCLCVFEREKNIVRQGIEFVS